MRIARAFDYPDLSRKYKFRQFTPDSVMKSCHQNEALSQESWFTLYKPVISEETLKKFLDEDNIKTNFWNLFKIFVQKKYIEPKVLKVEYMTIFSCPWNCF